MKKSVTVAIAMALILVVGACYAHVDAPAKRKITPVMQEDITKAILTLFYLNQVDLDIGTHRENTIYWIKTAPKATRLRLLLYIKYPGPSWAQRRFRRQIRRENRRKRYEHHFMFEKKKHKSKHIKKSKKLISGKKK